MKKINLTAVILLLYLLTGCSLLPWAQQSETGPLVFAQGDITSVNISMDSGQLALVGSAEPTVQVRWLMHSQYDIIDTNIQKGVLKVITRADIDPSARRGSETVRLTVQVPAGVPVEVKSKEAMVQVKGYDGTIKIVTSSGPISAANLHGTADLVSTNGSISLNGGEGNFTLFSPQETLTASGLHGVLTLGTIGGSLYYTGEPARSDSVHLQSVGGPVEVELGKGSDSKIEIFSVSGKVDCPAPDLRIQSGCRGKIGAGSADFGVRTVGGRISISMAGK